MIAAVICLGMPTPALAGSPSKEPAPETAQPLRGIVKAVQQAAFSTELLAPVARIGFREGETFKAGDVLVAFDCTRQGHELSALAATEREMAVAVETSRLLIQRGAANRNDVEIAAARHDKARAEAAAMGARLRHCQVLAPFDGSVAELSINAHELPTPNRPFLVVAGRDDLEIEIIMPSRLLKGIRAGDAFEFAIDETGERHPARIKRAAGVVDAMSQTVKVFGRLELAGPRVLPGMSGTARLAPIEER